MGKLFREDGLKMLCAHASHTHTHICMTRMFCHECGGQEIWAQVYAPGASGQCDCGGGVTAALVSSFLRDPAPVFPPLSHICQELPDTGIHWPSLFAGLVLGLILGQLVELFILLRQYLLARLRFQFGVVGNNWAVKNRIGG